MSEKRSDTAAPHSAHRPLPESRPRAVQNERPKPGKKGRRRSKTIPNRRLTKEEQATAQQLRTFKYERPRHRDECEDGLRPCPFVSCKHHLYLDVNEETGSIKLNFPDLEVWEMKESCALDVAHRGGITLEEVGEILNLTRERIRQVEVKGLSKLRDVSDERGLRDFLTFLEDNLGVD